VLSLPNTVIYFITACFLWVTLNQHLFLMSVLNLLPATDPFNFTVFREKHTEIRPRVEPGGPGRATPHFHPRNRIRLGSVTQNNCFNLRRSQMSKCEPELSSFLRCAVTRAIGTAVGASPTLGLADLGRPGVKQGRASWRLLHAHRASRQGGPEFLAFFGGCIEAPDFRHLSRRVPISRRNVVFSHGVSFYGSCCCWVVDDRRKKCKSVD